MKKLLVSVFIFSFVISNVAFAQSSSTYDNLVSTIKAGIMQATNLPFATVVNLFGAGEESPDDYAVSGKNPPTYLRSSKDDYDIKQRNNPEKVNSSWKELFKDMEENPEKYGVKPKKQVNDPYADPDKIETSSTNKEQEEKGSEGGTPQLPKLPETGGAGQDSKSGSGESIGDESAPTESQKLEAGKALKQTKCIALAKDVNEPIAMETFGEGYSIVDLEPEGEGKVTKVLQSRKTFLKLAQGNNYIANKDFAPITDERKKTCCKKVAMRNGQLTCLESNGKSDHESNLGQTGLKNTN